MLIQSEILSKGLVKNVQPIGLRDSTYDATVGEIIEQGKIISELEYTLKPRHIVWLTSNETFCLPSDITGLATLRTTWTHNGVLALNVGIVDPGWEGPLATAVVNFGEKNFYIKKGDAFLRLLFLEHQPTAVKALTNTKTDYINKAAINSKHFSATFLSMDSLVDEISREIFKMPTLGIWLTKVGVWLSAAALLLTLLSIYAPIAWSVWSDHAADTAKLSTLIQEVADLKEKTKTLEEKQKTQPLVLKEAQQNHGNQTSP
jgi:deoxycytidine triphosphate deaminase